MYRLKTALNAAIIAGVTASAPVWALDFGPDSYKLYGGSYSPDCANPALPRLRVTPGTLVFELGKNRITGRNVQDAVSYWGNQEAPPGYLTVLMSELRGGEQMLFFMQRDRNGQFATIDGDKKLTDALGKRYTALKYRDCDPAAHPAPVAVAPPPVDHSVWVPRNDARFKAAYRKALGGLARQPWLINMDGPAPEPREVRVAGESYRLIAVAKAHDAYDNNMVVLYSSARRVVYGKVQQNGRGTLIGQPPPVVAAELERLWRGEWRQGQ
jgi:hypothetical protein